MDNRVRNVFACLVHESRDCVIDLVQNLHALDPESPILLYNGGMDPSLLTSFPFERYGSMVVPDCQPMRWGRLHAFAVECMKFALRHLSFDMLTIVDSDQVAVRSGYSQYLGRFNFGKSTGMLGNSPGVKKASTKIALAQAAYKEVDLWLPLLRCFPAGEEKFVHWTFWPGTVFFQDACRDLVKIFESNQQLLDVIQRTEIWASEEVFLPTLVALLGYEVELNPCSYEYVQHQVSYSLSEAERALALPDVFWLHPVPRFYDDGLRTRLREHTACLNRDAFARREVECCTVAAWPVLRKMQEVRGWLEVAEADLLMVAVEHALSSLGGSVSVVEVGSYCGRSTVVLGSVVASICPSAGVYAIDPHGGKIGAIDRDLSTGPSTLAEFEQNIKNWDLTAIVNVITQASTDVEWNRSIGFLFIDGLHDYVSVAQDFFHFEPWLVAGGPVAFHDYGDYYPGVQLFVDELLRGGAFKVIGRAGTLIILEKLFQNFRVATELQQLAESGRSDSSKIVAPLRRSHWPLVSCIMPTFGRPSLVSQSIRYFLRQDYPACELVVVDDGTVPVEHLMPGDPRIRYEFLSERHSLGGKRNIACDLARGELIVHWDDDDWSAPWRLSYQVEELLQRRSQSVCGLAQVRFYSPRSAAAWRYSYPANERAWVCGGTLCYYKALWRAQPFLDLWEGEDNEFVWSVSEEEIAPLYDDSFFIGLIHPDNSSRKHPEGSRWFPYPERLIRQQIGDDLAFYLRLLEQSDQNR